MFSLTATFTAPPGGNGGPFSASVTGRVRGNGITHQFTIDFGPAQLVTYTGGSFMLQVNDVTFNTLGSQFVGGQITQDQSTAVPDGGSAVVLLGLALTGLEVVRRKLRRD